MSRGLDDVPGGPARLQTASVRTGSPTFRNPKVPASRRMPRKGVAARILVCGRWVSRNAAACWEWARTVISAANLPNIWRTNSILIGHEKATVKQPSQQQDRAGRPDPDGVLARRE